MKNSSSNIVTKPQQYEAPSIEVVEVKVEHGFAGSLPGPGGGDDDGEESW